MEVQPTIYIDFERLIGNVDKAACDKLREYFPNQTKDLQDPDERRCFEISKQLSSKLQQKMEKIYSEVSCYFNSVC